MSLASRALQSLTFYPVSTMWGAGTVLAVGIAGGWVALEPGLVGLTLTAVAVLLIANLRETRTVHHLVNSQRDMLLARISDLVDTLEDAGVSLPPRERDAQKATDDRVTDK